MKRIGPRSPGSYGLKHVAERAIPTSPPFRYFYISNGALITAAFALELPVKRKHRTSPNAWIGIVTRELNRDIVEKERRRREAAMRAAYEARKRIP